jgi:uncharacterized protein YjcR
MKNNQNDDDIQKEIDQTRNDINDMQLLEQMIGSLTGHGGARPGAGAPRGNQNAVKHGKYSRILKRLDELEKKKRRNASKTIDEVNSLIIRREAEGGGNET